ncbi:MAG: hypothetical protein HDQ88_08960 [Clostridia bacterium]|nr:hypothetical protein [Clostridia bacterium]
MSRYVLTIREQIKLQRICKAFRVLYVSLYTCPNKTMEQTELMYKLTDAKGFFEEFCGENTKAYKPKNDILRQISKLNHKISEFRLKLQTLGRDQRYVNDELRNIQNVLLDYVHVVRNQVL